MGFRNVVIYNYTSHIFTIFLGLVAAPIYLRYLGADNYGLVAFGASLQLFVQLFDFGMAGVVVREVAKCDFAPSKNAYVPRLFQYIRNYYVIVGLLVFVSVYLFSALVVRKWLTLDGVDEGVATDAIKIIAILIALRWGAGLMRAVMAGAQDFRWLSLFNVGSSTLAFIATLVVLHVEGGLLAFVLIQFIHATLELILLSFRCRKRLSSITSKIPFDSSNLLKGKSIFFFGIGLTLTSTLWLFVSQLDRLLLSKFLNLAEFSYFVLTVTLAAGIGTISAPLGNVLLPKLSQLSSDSHRHEFLEFYLKSTGLLCVIVFPVAVTFSLFPQSVLYAWTGNFELAANYSDILAIYSASAVFVSLCSFQYYMQFAHGNLSLHIKGHLIYALISIPALIYAAREFSTLGVAVVYLIANGSYFFFWVPYVHMKFYRELHRSWLVESILPVLLSTCVTATILVLLMDFDEKDRLVILGKLIFVGISLLLSALLSLRRFRQLVSSHFLSWV